VPNDSACVASAGGLNVGRTRNVVTIAGVIDCAILIAAIPTLATFLRFVVSTTMASNARKSLVLLPFYVHQ
jgi:hypothetical protein